MNTKRILWRFFLILLCLEVLLGWGFFSHKKINYHFVMSLRGNNDAKPLFNFYNKHIDYIVDHAGDPDSRRIYSPSEKGKHFINIECFGEDLMRQDYVSYNEFINYYAYNLAKKLRPDLKTNEEIEKYVKNTIVRKYGTVPFAIIYAKKVLTEAFKNKDIAHILLETVNLSHYIADSCVVFHCTENYDGQLTGQNGIHAFWESTIPQYFFDEFGVERSIRPAQYDKDFNRRVWLNVLHSNVESRRALDVEKQLDQDVSIGKFCYKAKNNNVNRMHSKEYAREYNRRLNGQIADQINRAIKLTADAVYTAWVDAGKPVLLDIVQENSPVQCGEGSESNKLIVSNKNGKEKVERENKNLKKVFKNGKEKFIGVKEGGEDNKDNTTGNVTKDNNRNTKNRVVNSVVACFVVSLVAYLFNNKRRKKRKEKRRNGKKRNKE